MATGAWQTLIFALLLFAPAISGVEIRGLTVPSLVSLSNASSVVLDCDYEYSSDEERELDVKWYFGEDPAPFFQWLPAHQTRPQILGRFADHVDVEYQAENEMDRLKAYRSVRIVDIGPEFSGEYRCKVSTFGDEDFRQAAMLVYAAPKEVIFAMDDHESLVNLSCNVNAVYPEPSLTISWHDKDEVLHEDSEISVEEREDAMFDGRLVLAVPKERLGAETTFTCDFRLAETNVSLTQSLVLSSDNTDNLEHQNTSTTESYEDYYSAFEDDFYYVSAAKSVFHVSFWLLILIFINLG